MLFRSDFQLQRREFLGMLGYYRNFILDFAKIAQPLFETLKGRVHGEIEPSLEMAEAFETLKKALMQAPVLQFPNFELPFVLETDASSLKVAAVLMQDHEKGRVLISCASRTLKDAEKNYSIVEKEALAIVFGVKYYRNFLVEIGRAHV